MVLVRRPVEVILARVLALVTCAVMLDPAACVRDPSHVEVVDSHVEVEALR